MNKKKIFFILLFIIALAFAIYNREIFLAKDFIPNFIERCGFWGPVIFCLFYLVAALAFFPASFITVFAGILFGHYLGLTYAVIGTVLGSVFSFLIARYIAGDWARKRSSGIIEKVQSGVEKDGWKYLATMRVVPVFPFSILNYAFGLTRMSLMTFTITTVFANLPITLIYFYIGYLGTEFTGGFCDFIK